MHFDSGISKAVILSDYNGFKPFIGSVGILDGRIACVKEEAIFPSECETWIDGSDRILMPGFVNAHCHGDMTLAKGFGDDLTLDEQNRAFGDTNWFKTLITDEERADSRLLTYAESLLSGTTFQLENMYWGLGARSAELLAEAGIRGACAEDIRKDYTQPEIFLTEEELGVFLKSCEENGIVPVIGSISEEDFSEPLVKRIQAAVKRLHFHLSGRDAQRIQKAAKGLSVRQTFHLAEADWRMELIRKKFGTTPVRWLQSLGILDSDVIGSHVVHVDADEIRYLAETGTSVANTPLCEMKIADGAAPIAEMVKAGVNVCLGTDGAMWNNSSDIFREMKGMSLLQTLRGGIRSIAAKDILRMATINGARAFGLEEDFGTVEEGKSADLILIRTDRPHMQPLVTGFCENVTSAVVFSATGRDVTDVFVRGRQVVRDGELLTMDVRELSAKVRKTTEKIAAHYRD